MSPTFADLGLAPALVSALTALGYEEPTPIQREAIPPLLAGGDLLGQAATGTGKTAAFALPLLQRLFPRDAKPSRPALLVLAPTRELAMQVAEALHRYGRPMGVSVVPIYGGQEFHRQIQALRRGVHVVVATPGRAIDHVKRGTLDLTGVESVVLDEADEMLDMGFAEDIELLLESIPSTRQVALFSATMPPRILGIAERHLTDPHRVRIRRERGEPGSLPRVRQTAYLLARAQKVAGLGRILDLEAPTLALIFCRTRTEVDTLAETLAGHGYRAEALHGGMTQEQRDRVMKRTRSGAVDLLVATDVAARGLDIEQLTHVVNFNVPESPAAYVHRIGRTGRAGREGVAITLVEPREHRLLRSIEQATQRRMEVATVPTVLDVRSRRLDVTRASIRGLILDGGLDGYRIAVEALADEFDLMDIATAAVRLAHEAGVSTTRGADDEVEMAAATLPAPDADEKRRAAEQAHVGDGAAGERSAARTKTARPAKAPAKPTGAGMARVYIGAGRKANIRPTDLVGAITNVAGIDPRGIGMIEIADKFSLVELPEDVADQVVVALRAGKIKGRRLTVRRDKATGRREDGAPSRKGSPSRKRSDRKR